MLFCFNDTATTEIYTLSLHDALPIFCDRRIVDRGDRDGHFSGGRAPVTVVDRVGEAVASVEVGVGRVAQRAIAVDGDRPGGDRKSTRLNSSHANISYAVFCLKTHTSQ